MRKIFWLFFAAVLFIWLPSCNNTGNKFVVDGQISNMPRQRVTLTEVGVNEQILVDTTWSDDNGHFELSANIPEPNIYSISFSGDKDKFILLSVDKGKMKLDADWNHLEKYSIVGSAPSVAFKTVIDAARSYVIDDETLTTVMDSMKARGNDSLYQKAFKQRTDRNTTFTLFLEKYADTTQYLPNAIFAAQRFLNPKSEKNFLAAMIQSKERKYPTVKLLKDYDDYFKKQITGGPAVKATDIKLQTPDGKEVALSSLRGKYVLVDFWASWCPPCRAENPNVVAAFNKFKDKNFTIYSVSLDTKKENWEKAISDDHLTWTHVSDLKSWDSPIVKAYGVEGIPANFLVDPQGNIIAKDLRGEMLDARLSEVLK